MLNPCDLRMDGIRQHAKPGRLHRSHFSVSMRATSRKPFHQQLCGENRIPLFLLAQTEVAELGVSTFQFLLTNVATHGHLLHHL